MDPISLAIGAVGLGMQIFGGMSQSEHAKEAASISQDEARQEQGINDEKQKAMEINARRQKLEIMRTQQKANALATTSATSQNAQFGSGLQGGLAEISGQTNFNLEGVDSALSTGRSIAGFNRNISSDKMQMADVQSQMATDQGYASLGGALLKAGPTIGAMSKGFGSLNLGSIFMGGGSPSGYGK